MIVIIDDKLQAMILNDKLYIKTPLQTFLLSPHYRENVAYDSILKSISQRQCKTISEVVDMCNNKVDMTYVSYELLGV